MNPKTKTCTCEKRPTAYWTCCACGNWTLRDKRECSSCGHHRRRFREDDRVST